MKLSVLLSGAILASCCAFVSSLIIPIVTGTAGATSTLGLTVSSASIAAGLAGAAATAGIVGLGLVALRVAAQRSSHKLRTRRDIDEDTIQEMFEIVAQVDVNACGLKLVCDLYQKPKSDLSEKESAILHLIGENPKPVAPEKVKDPRARYQSAAILGLRGEKCSVLYASCPLTEDKVHAYLDTLEVQGNKNFKEILENHKISA
ncbi:uncharacterized protein [Macrobrachium rosenbergii]|uniref:uncharacterized protein n=1 Tax=Macrobrachium rosenbergii TaxID=79674 RepID=UPI0034D453B3